MVQNYGVAPKSAHTVATDNDTDILTPGGAGETSALLGENSTGSRVVGKPDGHAGLISCVSNLSNTIIGSGGFVVSHSSFRC